MEAEYFFKSTLVADKKRGWAQVIDEMFGSVDIKISNPSTFFGEIRRSTLGDMELTEVVSDYEDSRRTKHHIARDTKEFFVLVLVKHGKLVIEQFDRECVLGPGTLALFDLNSPYRYCHSERTDVLDIKIPAFMLNARMADPYRFTVQGRATQAGPGRVTADFISSLAAEAARIPDDIAQSYACRVADMVHTLFESDAGDLPIRDSIARSALYRRCASFIESYSSDADLDAEKIAAAMGISVRYLHKIFQDAGQSVGEFLRTYRLKRCHDDLIDFQKRKVSIKEIALRAGFRSQSHFASAFKRHYRISPSKARLRGARQLVQ